MRLPAISVRQQQAEDARCFHETLWKAHQKEKPLIVPHDGEPGGASRVIKKLSWGLGDFWKRRGFWMRCQQTEDKAAVRVWLQPR